MPNRWIQGLLAGLFALLCALPAQAGDFELTPFFGYQFGGTFEEGFDSDNSVFLFDDIDVEESQTLGLIADFSLSKNAQIELLYSYQDTDLERTGFFRNEDLGEVEIEYFHAGFLWQWGGGQVRPFVVATAGVTRFAFDDDNDSKFSAGFGGGVKIFVSDHIGFRFDGRFSSTFIEEGEEINCSRRRNRCYRYEDDLSLIQLDAKFGIIFAF